MQIFYAYAFGVILLFVATVQVYLNLRQIKHIANNYNLVPGYFKQYVSLEQHQKSSKYNIEKLKLNIFDNIVQSIVLLSLTLLGGMQTLNYFLNKNITNHYIYAGALFLSFIIITSVPSTIIAYIKQFKIEKKYGFNNMSVKLFIIDNIKQSLLFIILFTPLFIGFITIFSLNFGWFYMWLLFVLFNLLLFIIYPKYIAPLFNKFTPLNHPELVSKIKIIFAQAKVNLVDILVVDGSKRSTHANAYFTGLRNKRRIVLFDTLLKQLNNNQIVAVIAHELGHLYCKHIIKNLVKSLVISLIIMFIIHKMIDSLFLYKFVNIIPNIQGITSIHNNYTLGLIAFFILISVFSFFLLPLNNITSRKYEFEADTFAAKLCPASDLTSALTKLYDDNCSPLTSDNLYAKFYYTHPSAIDRIKHLQSIK